MNAGFPVVFVGARTRCRQGCPQVTRTVYETLQPIAGDPVTPGTSGESARPCGGQGTVPAGRCCPYPGRGPASAGVRAGPAGPRPLRGPRRPRRRPGGRRAWAGCGDLELAAADVLGGRIAWVSGGQGAVQLAARFPGITGLGEVSSAHWAVAPRTDAITVGFPCRSGCHAAAVPGDNCGWAPVPEAVRALRPGLAFVENSAQGLPRVLADLTALGYSTRWARLWHPRDSGATGNERIVVLAWQPTASGHGRVPADSPASRWPQRRRMPCPAAKPPARRKSTRPTRHSRFAGLGADAAARSRIIGCRKAGPAGVPASPCHANHTPSRRAPLRRPASGHGPGDHRPPIPGYATGPGSWAAARDPGSGSERDQVAAVLRLLLESAARLPSRLGAASGCDRSEPRTASTHPGRTYWTLITPACCIGGCHGRPT